MRLLVALSILALLLAAVSPALAGDEFYPGDDPPWASSGADNGGSTACSAGLTCGSGSPPANSNAGSTNPSASSQK